MEYPEVTSQQRDSIISLASDAEVIRKFARSLTDRLIAVFRDSEVKYHLEVEIDPDTESSLGHLLIKSAFGDARGRLAFFVDDSGIQGEYLFEKRGVDPFGRPAWFEAWKLLIQKDGLVSPGGSKTGQINARNFFATTQDNQMYEIARSLIYRLGLKVS
ncbi:hypothetical protein [Pseudomonas lini]|uniref:Uncharacterized protein n=1 Tax=Pseudomonas lini TaxID=163011 RepID=A0A0J6KFK3_9PSED|nr:hypothetical protein [Pseudomonas lini]KAB0502784.1 hypothetical protein F7R14_19300 [Pseudomonas lini]KMM94937.1 hypothetical protein TU81_00450 [Pseudomonas lini]SDT22013.1 hypothetical protein SAMN04490191_3540 [Pseudomonas lini]